jgi:hypothetical protein
VGAGGRTSRRALRPHRRGRSPALLAVHASTAFLGQTGGVGSVLMAATGGRGTRTSLAAVVSHPIQHFAPWFREITRLRELDLKVFYRCDWAVRQYDDPGFGSSFRCDVPLLEGYPHQFLPIRRRPRRLTFRQVDNPTVAGSLEAFRPDVVMGSGTAIGRCGARGCGPGDVAVPSCCIRTPPSLAAHRSGNGPSRIPFSSTSIATSMGPSRWARTTAPTISSTACRRTASSRACTPWITNGSGPQSRIRAEHATDGPGASGDPPGRVRRPVLWEAGSSQATARCAGGARFAPRTGHAPVGAGRRPWIGTRPGGAILYGPAGSRMRPSPDS